MQIHYREPGRQIDRQTDGRKEGKKDTNGCAIFSILSQEKHKYIFETKVRIQLTIK